MSNLEKTVKRIAEKHGVVYARWANGTDEKYYISYPHDDYNLLDSILSAVKRSKNAAISDWDYRRGMVDVASPETVERENRERYLQIVNRGKM